MSKTIGKSLYKKWWFWLLLLAVLGSISKLGEDKSVQETVAVKQETQKQEAPGKQEQPQPSPTKTQPNNDGGHSQSVTNNSTTAPSTQTSSGFVHLNGRGTSDEGRSEPQYEGLVGFAAASSSNVMDISDISSKFPNGPWNVPTVKQIDDNKFEETNTYIPHKTKVKVIKQILHHEGFSNYEGGLLVEDVKTKKQFYIDVYNFVTFPYWEASIEVALKQGPVIATYTPTSVKPTDRDGEWVELKSGTEVVADSVENTGRHSGKVKADVYKQWSQGYGGVDVYFDPASLKIKY